MAIMWDPPADPPSLRPTPAELTWRLWVVQALAASNPRPSPDRSSHP